MFVHGELEGARIEIGWVAAADVTVRVHLALAKVGAEGSNPFARSNFLVT